MPKEDPFKNGQAPETKPRSRGATAEEDPQGTLIDTDHPAAKKVKSLIAKIRNADKDRSEAQERSTKARQELIEVGKEHKLGVQFVCGGNIVKFTATKEKVSIRKAEDASDGDSDE